MANYDHARKLNPCRVRNCHVTAALMEGDLCIRHWYKSIGKECPDITGTVKTPRPSIDRNTAVTGKRDTSRGAASRVLPSTGTKRRTVYDAIMANMANGMTCDEICVETGMLVQSATSAINGLVYDKWLRDSGLRRPTRTGTLATVWVAL
jgi:hypothetical protein